jgi:Zn-dependent peptidase ImmA (M78 family)
MRCLHRDIGPSGGTDWSAIRRAPRWHEVQANRGMAALLMPRAVFRRLALRIMQDNGVPAGTSIAEGTTDPVITEVAATFEVSKQAAGIRLTTERLLGQ